MVWTLRAIPGWGRLIEGAGKTPISVPPSRAQVRGLQGAELGGPIVYSPAQTFRGSVRRRPAAVTKRRTFPDELLWNVYFPHFKAALDAGVRHLMSAYMDLNDVPATGNRVPADRCPSKRLGFKGFV